MVVSLTPTARGRDPRCDRPGENTVISMVFGTLRPNSLTLADYESPNLIGGPKKLRSLYLLGEEDRIIGVSRCGAAISGPAREAASLDLYVSRHPENSRPRSGSDSEPSTIAADLIRAGVAVHPVVRGRPAFQRALAGKIVRPPRPRIRKCRLSVTITLRKSSDYFPVLSVLP